MIDLGIGFLKRMRGSLHIGWEPNFESIFQILIKARYIKSIIIKKNSPCRMSLKIEFGPETGNAKPQNG